MAQLRSYFSCGYKWNYIHKNVVKQYDTVNVKNALVKSVLWWVTEYIVCNLIAAVAVECWISNILLTSVFVSESGVLKKNMESPQFHFLLCKKVFNLEQFLLWWLSKILVFMYDALWLVRVVGNFWMAISAVVLTFCVFEETILSSKEFCWPLDVNGYTIYRRKII
jgi:hypothetical protein